MQNSLVLIPVGLLAERIVDILCSAEREDEGSDRMMKPGSYVEVRGITASAAHRDITSDITT